MNASIKITILCIFFYKCTFVSEISTYKDLKNNLENNIQIVSNDTSVYYVNNFSYSDSSITIKAIKSKKENKENFEGELFFKDIAYIQTYESNTWTTLAFAGLNIFLVSNGVQFFSSATDLIPYLHFSYGGGSCPFIYSWNRNNYKLEGEVFGISLGKSLETETNIILDDLVPEENKINIQISNERPETHFINSVKVSAIEINEDETIFTDNHQNVQTVKELKSVSKIEDRNNNNITNLIKNADDIYWQSDLTSATSENNFEDILYCSINNLWETDSVSLIITAINTEISNICFGYLQKVLGEEFVNFTKAIETDPDLTSAMKNILVKSALKVDVWNGRDWNYIDLIYPEANYIKFKKLIRLPIFNKNYHEIKIRLRCLSDVWEIDAIQYDDSPISNYNLLNTKLISYNSNTINNVESILKKDEKYAKLLPEQNIQLQYSEIKSKPGKKIMYNANISGYLYEWIIEDNSLAGNCIAVNISSPKMILAKQLLNNIEIVLPIIYKEWENYKTKFALAK
ncbi:MAG: hypothetical protein WAR79_09670 [Melioribacteraceae bacterium]